MISWISGAAACRELDRRLIEDVGVPGLSLMEIAGRGVADVAGETMSRGDRFVVLAGPGNNGGDGYVAARWLHARGVSVTVLASDAPATPDAAAMARAAERAGVPVARWTGTLPPAEWVVDALLGTGARAALSGNIAAMVEALGDRSVLAVDLPTGVAADTGAASALAVTARHTVTFGRFKPAMFAGEGRDRCGRLHRVDLGQEAVDPTGALACAELGLGERPPVPIPTRRPGAYKSGHLLVVAGNAQMAGAAILVCQGALAAGAGLLTAWASSDASARLATLPPEVMLALEPPDLTRFRAVVAGPGLGRPTDPVRSAWLASAWGDPARPVLFDADALPLAGEGGGERVITPHPGEAAQILGISGRDVEADRFAAATALARGRVVVLKGQNSLVAAPGQRTWVNVTGGPALATGGSGDVLSGVMGAFLSRGLTAFDAARLAVWVHGRAADALAAEGIPEPRASQLPAAIAACLARSR